MTIEQLKQQHDLLISRACRYLIVTLLDYGVGIEKARKEAEILEKFMRSAIHIQL